MQDVPEQVYVSAADGLLGEEVVRHELDSIMQLRPQQPGPGCHRLGQVLDDEACLFARDFGDADRHGAVSAPDVDDDGTMVLRSLVAKARGPVETPRDVIAREPTPLRHPHHSGAEAARSLLVGLEL